MKPYLTFLLIPPIALAGCQQEYDSPEGTMPEESITEAMPLEGVNDMGAVADISPTEGHEARGTVRFSNQGGTLRLVGTITGLAPGDHGFHIHEFGDCSAPDASTAGGHFNPQDNPHGSPQAPANEHHAGDLGNLTANEQGVAEVDFEDNEMQMSGLESVIGKALVLHAGQDDLESQPSGNSGDRVGCGEILASSSADPL